MKIFQKMEKELKVNIMSFAENFSRIIILQVIEKVISINYVHPSLLACVLASKLQ